MKQGWIWVAVMLAWASLAQAEDLTLKARQALQDGHTQQAADLLQQQVKAAPDDYQAWFLLGVAQAKVQRYHPAIESFRRVLELRPDLAEPHNNLAVIYNELGDVRAAIKELEASLEKHPGYLVAEENIADLYIKMALTYYKKALEKTDDAALQARYARLLQVRDVSGGTMMAQTEKTASPASDTSASMPMAQTKQAATHPAAVEPAATPAARPTMPTVASTMGASSSKPAQASDADLLQEVKQAVENWRQAWQSQNIPAYFSAYADDYMPPSRFKDLSAWETYKVRVIGNKKFIKVTLSDMKVELAADKQHAVVQFHQAFRSNSYNGDDQKQLTLEKRADGWKIVKEETR